jgi:antitoxin ParD1/3/4
MALTLTSRIEALVLERVESGEYRSADEVIEEALQALQDRDALQDLRRKLQIGRDEIARGESVVFTPSWSDDRWQRAIKRAKAGETLNPDVCPYANLS